jgi:hypothetical protein
MIRSAQEAQAPDVREDTNYVDCASDGGFASRDRDERKSDDSKPLAVRGGKADRWGAAKAAAVGSGGDETNRISQLMMNDPQKPARWKHPPLPRDGCNRRVGRGA